MDEVVGGVNPLRIYPNADVSVTKYQQRRRRRRRPI